MTSSIEEEICRGEDEAVNDSPEHVLVTQQQLAARQLQSLVSKLSLITSGIGVVAGLIVLLMNSVGCIASGLWLAVLGEWRAIGLGVFNLFFASSFLGWCIMPSLLFFPLITYGQRKGNVGITFAGGVLSLWCKYFVVALWLAGVYAYFKHITHPAALIPTCLFSFTIATSPWISLGSRERDNEQTMLSLIVINTLSLFLAIGFAVLGFNFATAFWICVGVLNTFSLLQFRLVFLKGIATGEMRFSEAPPLRWYQAVWAYPPGLLVPFGGYILGLAGISAAYANYRIFQSRIPTFFKYLFTAGISFFTFLSYVVMSMVITLATRK